VRLQVGAVRAVRACARALMMRSLVTPFVACATLATQGCDIDRVIVCSVAAPTAIATRGAALLNGSERGEFAALGPADEAAVVHVDARDASGGQLGSCSGTAIGERWVLSAAHCVPEGTVAISVSIGANAGAPERRIEAQVAGRHPQLDLGVIELSPDALVPSTLPLATRVPDVGAVVQLAGFGEDGLGVLGHRRFVAEEVTAVDPDSIVVDGQGRSGACRGDSGGPLMVRDRDGGVAIAGVLRGGNVTCAGVDRYVRVDVARDWISSVATLQPSRPGCGALKPVGRCFEGMATWCQEGGLRSESCTNGLACGWDVRFSGFRCVEPAADPCDGVDDRGLCEGSVLLRCIAGALQESDCESCGAACARDPKTGTAACERELSHTTDASAPGR